MVLIAIPVETKKGVKSALGEHFNKAGQYAVLEYDNGKVVDLRFLANQGAEGSLSNAGLLVESGVEVLLASSIGPHSIATFLEGGARVFKGASGSIESALKDYSAGKLDEVLTVEEHHHH